MDAYEKSLLDVMQGDHMLFWRQDGVELCWSYFSPLIEECETCAFLERLIHPYPSGTWGPEKAQALMEELRGGWGERSSPTLPANNPFHPQ
jgi:glucose-6-phosphate 1-dehydrogenase